MLRKIDSILVLAVLLASCGKEKEKVAPAPAAKADKQAPPDQPPPNQPEPPKPPVPPVLAWAERAALPTQGGQTRHVSFVINGKSYIYGGSNGLCGADCPSNDLWEYDPQSNQWTKKASLPLPKGRCSASAFVLNGKGYIVGGGQGTILNPIDLGDLWEYEPQTDQWTQKASLPVGRERHFATSFAISGKGYVTTGVIEPKYPEMHTYRDLWEYDPQTNQWTERTSLPAGEARYSALSFVLSDKAYVVGGFDLEAYGLYGSYFKDDVYPVNVWQYDPKADTWTQMSSLPAGKGRERASCFVIGDRGYLVGGLRLGIGITGKDYGDVWEYNSATNTWTEKAALPVGKERHDASGFGLNGKGYVVAGFRNNTGVLGDLLEYDPTKDQ